MSKLQRVTRKQAEQLKALGFDWKTDLYFLYRSETVPAMAEKDNSFCDWNCSNELISCPEVALALQWLRDEHLCFITIHKHCIGSDEWVFSYSMEYLPRVNHTDKRRAISFVYVHDTYDEGVSGYSGAFDEYEQAESAALDYALDYLTKQNKAV